MALVTTAEVLEIIDDTELEEASLMPFILVADALVTQHLSDKALSADLLKEIERWLSAHFVAIRDMRRKSEKLGDASDSYFGEAGMGLDFTPYGQQAKLLDPTGTLANLGQRRAMFKVL